MSMHRVVFAMLVLSFADALASEETNIAYQWELPAGVAPPMVPATARMTAERIELGRHLFYDQRLSGNGTTACASCHFQELAFTDGRAQPTGSTGALHPRSAMSLVNTAYRDALTWANPSLRTLEEQVLVPMFATTPVELGLQGEEARIYAELGRDSIYRSLFAAAFPDAESPITTTNVAASLAAFVRSIVSFRAPFDRYRFENDATALSASAQRGMKLFFSNKARCGGCHMAHNVSTDLGLNLDGGSKTAASPANDPPVFMFHNTGLYNLPGPIVYPADNTGLHAHTGLTADVGKFRVPTLRNIAVTAPYMHDGSIATLEKVLDHYANGGRAPNPLLSDSIRPITLSPEERDDLIAFLHSLTDEAALNDPRWSDPWKGKDKANTERTAVIR